MDTIMKLPKRIEARKQGTEALPLLAALALIIAFMFILRKDFMRQDVFTVEKNGKAVHYVRDYRSVNLLFEYTRYGNEAFLQWTVKEQAKEGYYFVQRSADGEDFETIRYFNAPRVTPPYLGWNSMSDAPGANCTYRILFLSKEDNTWFAGNAVKTNL